MEPTPKMSCSQQIQTYRSRIFVLLICIIPSFILWYYYTVISFPFEDYYQEVSNRAHFKPSHKDNGTGELSPNVEFKESIARNDDTEQLLAILSDNKTVETRETIVRYNATEQLPAIISDNKTVETRETTVRNNATEELSAIISDKKAEKGLDLDSISPPYKYFVGKAAIRGYFGFPDKEIPDNGNRNYPLITSWSKVNSSATEEAGIIALHDLKGNPNSVDKVLLDLQKKLMSEKPVIESITSNTVPWTIITMTTSDSPPINQKQVKFSQNPKIANWYTMNYKESNVKLNEAENKIKPFPLGIDFHTMHKEDHWGEKKTHWTKQNEIVHDIYFRASMKKWQNREYTLLYTGYSNTHGTRTSKGFLSLENASFTKHSGSCKQQGKCSTSRWETLEMMGKSKFVLAPRGLGMSTIRFYEALTVGAIPICDKLHSESMNNLHKMLGGIIVEDWKEVNSDNLSKWEDLITSNRFEEDEYVRHLEFSKRDYLYTEFWLDCVQRGVDCVEEHFKKIHR